MANITLNCAKCGAPVEYDGSDVPSITCSFCGSAVVIPAEMRPAKSTVIEFSTPPIYSAPTYPARSISRSLKWIIAGIIIASLICAAVSILAPILMTNSITQSISDQVMGIETAIPMDPTVSSVLTDIPAPTMAPSPTPGYELPGITFGQKGINPGQFDDTRYLASDGSTTIYTADYSGGRVQAFDLTGKYLYQWKVGTSKTIIEGLAADRKGGVYVSYDANIVHVNGKTGEVLAKLTNPKGGEFGDLLISPEGNLVAVWYEGRWGFITGLEGHSEDIVTFNPSGKVIKTLAAPISTQTEDPALDINIAMDGKDNLYAMDAGVIYVFNPDGKYLNMFGSSGSEPGQFSDPSAICTDKQGQIIVGDSSIVDIFSSGGQFIARFTNKGYNRDLAYDDNGSLWVLANDQVIQYTRPGK